MFEFHIFDKNVDYTMFHENSLGFWSQYEYKNNIVYYRNSSGYSNKF